MKKIKDMRYLLVVNGYSLGSIILLLERLNLLIDAQNGKTNELSGIRSLFFDNSPSAFDKKLKVFRYCLEYDSIEIFDDILKFLNYSEYSNMRHIEGLPIITLINGEPGVTENVRFENFFNKTPHFMAGLTLKEWGHILGEVIYCVHERIRHFIPDFNFELKKLNPKVEGGEFYKEWLADCVKV